MPQTGSIAAAACFAAMLAAATGMRGRAVMRGVRRMRMIL